jgi:lysozyme
MEIIISKNQLKNITEQYLGQAPKEPVNPFDFGNVLSNVNTVSSKAIDFIKGYENFSDVEYKCPSGKITIGYGTRLDYHPELKNKKIDKDVATAYLKKTIATETIPIIKKYVKIPLNQNQLDALVSLVYNIGPTKFINSQLLKALNSKNIESIKKNWEEFRLGDGKISNGLIRRRAEEIKQFFKKIWE